jgi:hypothetical protein
MAKRVHASDGIAVTLACMALFAALVCSQAGNGHLAGVASTVLQEIAPTAMAQTPGK